MTPAGALPETGAELDINNPPATRLLSVWQRDVLPAVNGKLKFLYKMAEIIKMNMSIGNIFRRIKKPRHKGADQTI